MINKYRPALNTASMAKEPVKIDIEEPEWQKIELLQKKYRKFIDEKMSAYRKLHKNEISDLSMSKGVEVIKSIRMETQFLNLSRAMLQIVAATASGIKDEIEIPEFPDGKGTTSIRITSYCQEESCSLTWYDIAIMDSVYTLMKHGTNSFTAIMVSHALIGDNSRKITEQKIASLEEALHKMSKIFVAVKHKEKGKSFTVSGSLMPVNPILAIRGNRSIMDGFSVSGSLALYDYAEKIGSIAEVPMSLFAAPSGNVDTDTVSIIRRFLIRHMETERCSSRKAESASDLWFEDGCGKNCPEALYSMLGFNPLDFSSWKNKKYKMNMVIRRFLNSFVEIGYIRSFQIIMGGPKQNQYYGVHIEF